jgi:alpha-galactosidase
MKIVHFCIGLIFLLKTGFVNAQSYASLSDKTLILDNGLVKRIIQLDTDGKGVMNKSYKLPNSKEDFISEGTKDFSFEANGKVLTGLDSWKLISIDMVKEENKGNGAKITMEHSASNLKIGITYLLYPGNPIIRKKISFLNTGKQNIKLESLDIESIHFGYTVNGTECWVVNDYARHKSLGQFVGTAYDPVVVVHEISRQRGVVLGNEAPGVMKRTDAFLKPHQLTTGLTHANENFGFRKWLKPDEQWESTWVFTTLYENTNDPSAVINGAVNDYVRSYMGTRLSQIKEKPTFVYNTWEPFFHNINEKMLFEVIDAAAECGFEEFVIDDGWQNSYGDWGINKTKFPNGLKPVFDHIKSKGMKPGVWISLAATEVVSNIYKTQPDWLVRKADGSPISLHTDSDMMYDWETYSMCMTTGWRDYIKGVILKMVREYGLEYIKADFAAVTGAYTTDKTRSGCHAKNHSHADRNESMLEMYQATWQLFDELHKEAPSLFIDCTFETMGALQLIDLDMCKHAEGNWLSNFPEKAPTGSLRVRQMSWWRSPIIPATAMVIGNQHLDDPNFELSLKSLAGSLPIVLGDPRLLSKEKRAYYKSWADWLRKMQGKHDFMSFRQDLAGFSEPAEGAWDGYQRINSDTKTGGIVGVFNQGAAESQRTVTIKYLNPSKTYKVKEAPAGRLITELTGKDLAEKGFKVNFTKKYAGAVYEISEK